MLYTIIEPTTAVNCFAMGLNYYGILTSEKSRVKITTVNYCSILITMVSISEVAIFKYFCK
jgi:hypothetical protein